MEPTPTLSYELPPAPASPNDTTSTSETDSDRVVHRRREIQRPRLRGQSSLLARPDPQERHEAQHDPRRAHAVRHR